MINNREKVAADFREEIKHAFEPEAKVLSADRELRYCLELQRARLAKRNLNCTDEMIHRGPFPNGLNRVRSWKDGHYDTSWTVDFIIHNKTMQREGMKTFKQNETQSIYETVVDVHDGDDVSSDTYCCPNCGSVSTIAELQEGCAYCGNEYKQENTDWVIYDIQNITKKIKIKRVITWLVVVAIFVGTFLYEMSMFYGLNNGF